MSDFIKGLELCEGFFLDVAKPILDKNYNNLLYTAGVIGYGADVIGFDDETSSDHMWGPRFYLFLNDKDIGLKDEIIELFSNQFPYTYKGYSVHFSEPDVNDGGVRRQEYIDNGKVSPLIFIYKFSDYLKSYLGVDSLDSLLPRDWLSFSQHKLLALTSGKLFVDGLNIGSELEKLKYYPEDVKLYLIASNWSLVAEEQAFVKRCHNVGDEIGSVLVCARIAERLMRLSFLYCNRYAPYSKWFGKAFGLLPISDEIKLTINKAITANNITQRENSIVKAQKLLADMHNLLSITEFVDVKIENYFGRDIKVIFADKIADHTAKKLIGTMLEKYPLIGTLSEVANFTAISDNAEYRDNVKALYQ